jgi:hypothetical protein
MLVMAGIVALGVMAYAGFARVGTSEASGLEAADYRAAVTSAAREVVKGVEGGSFGIARGASAQIRHLHTPADAGLPALFSVPTEDGGECIVSSVGVIASCLSGSSDLPGTITAADDSEGDNRPPFVYGLVRPNVREVAVSINGTRHVAGLGVGFYLFQLASADNRVDDLKAVTFSLVDGREVTRVVRD